MKHKNLHDLTIADASKLIESKKLSPVEYVDHLSARTQLLDKQVHAFITPTFELARKQAQSADIGVFVCDTQDYKMFNALPNKLFEYVWAGIPQVSSHGSEVDPIFREHKIGQLFDAYDPQSFAKAVKFLMDEETYYKQKKNVETYRKKLISQNDWSQFCLHSRSSASTPSKD